MLLAMRKKMKNQKGFTLIELMVVIAIIGILAAVAIPKFSTASNSARLAKIQADLSSIDSACSIYQAATGAAPADDASGKLSVLVPNYLATIPSSPTATTTGTGTVSINSNALYVIVGGRGAIVGIGGTEVAGDLLVEEVK